MGERVTVIGAGKSGVAAANFLVRQGYDVAITDLAAELALPLAKSLDPSVIRFFSGRTEGALEATSLVVLSPGVPRASDLVREAEVRSIPVISEIELAFRHLQGRVIAITGSNGKSTTTALIGEILRCAGHDPVIAGNIGEPLVSAIDASRSRTYVIELSSFQLESVVSFRANVALLLNITPDHMDRYSSIDEYAAAKYNIFRNQRPNDVAIVNADDPRTAEPPTEGRVVRFSSSQQLDEGAFLDGEDLVFRDSGGERRIPRSSLVISGIANVENALASWLAARAAGADDMSVQIAFGKFRGLPHRMVLVREIDGVRWINDSKGTNVDATLKSLEGQQDGRVVLILGGKDKAGEFHRLRELIARKAHHVLTIGSAGGKIAQEIDGASVIVPCGRMEEAVAWARENARAGDVVLLSPACASFDQYTNFEERGAHFESLVNSIEETSA